MNRLVVKSKVGHDGMLHLDLAVGSEEADKEVQVTVESIPPTNMTQDEWRQAILGTAGQWQGEFQRPDQGEYEEREPLS